DLGVHVAVRGYHAPVLDRDVHAAAGAAVAAWRLVPLQRGQVALGDDVAAGAGQRQAGRGGGRGQCAVADEITTCAHGPLRSWTGWTVKARVRRARAPARRGGRPAAR